MFQPVWSAIVSQKYSKQRALLKGFARYQVRDEDYPAIIPAEQSAEVPNEVHGVIYRDIDAVDLLRLDDFEGDQYYRKGVTVELEDQTTLTAHSYIFRPEYRHLLIEKSWKPEAFELYKMPRFLNRHWDFFSPDD